MKLVVGVTGASGTIYAYRLLETLRQRKDIETHLIMSDWARSTLETETEYKVEDMRKLASAVYGNSDMGAAISSGSYKTNGMIILPCSMKTLASIACGYCDTLIARAADVTLKEGRTLVLSPRESPLNPIHLENMLKLSRIGVRIVPPMPAFYGKPTGLDDLIDFHVMRLLDQFDISIKDAGRWTGTIK